MPLVHYKPFSDCFFFFFNAFHAGQSEARKEEKGSVLHAPGRLSLFQFFSASFTTMISIFKECRVLT